MHKCMPFRRHHRESFLLAGVRQLVGVRLLAALERVQHVSLDLLQNLTCLPLRHETALFQLRHVVSGFVEQDLTHVVTLDNVHICLWHLFKGSVCHFNLEVTVRKKNTHMVKYGMGLRKKGGQGPPTIHPAQSSLLR